MKGYWYVPAFSAVAIFLTMYVQTQLFFIAYLLWLVFLYTHKRLGKIVMVISLTFLFFFLFYIPKIPSLIHEAKPPQIVQLSGTVNGQVSITDQMVQFQIHETKTTEKLLVLYFAKPQEEIEQIIRKTGLRRGAACQIEGELSIPEASNNPGQFDYQMYLAQKNIFYQVTLQSLDDLSCQGASVLDRIDQFRKNLELRLKKKYSQTTIEWMMSLVFGDDSLLADETIGLFRRWSLSHLLAISGLHVGLVIGFLYVLLIKTGLLTKEKSQWLLILFLPFYAFIAGGEPSVWRASLMGLFVIVLSKVRFQMTVSDIISIVFLCLLLLDPYFIYHLGFQLSFIVTFSLILSGKWIRQDQSLFIQLLKISFVAQMTILPLQFSYFYTVQPLSVLVNVLVVPYFSIFVIPMMFLFVIISPIPQLPQLMDQLFVNVHTYMMGIIEDIDQVAYYPWYHGPLPTIIVVIYYGLFILMMFLLERKKLYHAFVTGCIITAVLMAIFIQPYFSPKGSVTMLDIGQGEAFVIELPFRKGVIMIDAGSSFSFTDMKPSSRVYKQIIKPYLQYKGIQQIDAIFISHEDLDHMGSIDFIIKEFKVKQIFVSDYYDIPREQLQSWMENGTRLHRLSHYDEIIISGQSFKVLAPIKKTDSENENSLVLFTELGNHSWLFTGDIGKDVEADLMEMYPNLHVDIIKISHHGSKYSSDQAFIQAINPTYALISVGENNRYGHPATEVIDILNEEKVFILRTDQDGAVIYQYHGQGNIFYKFRQNKSESD